MELYQIISLIIDGLVMMAGFSAIVIYVIQQRDKKKTAATLIVTQIDHIESNIRLLADADSVDEVLIYKAKHLLDFNYWDDNRYFLIKKLGVNNIKVIDDFYSKVEEIEKSRMIVSEEVMNTWKCKELVYQFQLSNEIIADSNFNIEKSKVLKFARSGDTFSARLPKDYLIKHLNSFDYISGTVAYDKLRKMSYYT